MSGQRVNQHQSNMELMRQNLQKQKQITNCDRVIQGNKMTETAKNEFGDIVKVSVFLDKNGDGKYERGEVISVRYNNVGSRNQDWVEYRDTNGDGYCDEKATGDWMGGEQVVKEKPDPHHGKDGQRMDLKYGFKWDANGPMYLK